MRTESILSPPRLISWLAMGCGLACILAGTNPAHAEFSLRQCVDAQSMRGGDVVDCDGHLRTTRSSEVELLRRLSYGMASSVDCTFRLRVDKAAAKTALRSRDRLRFAPFTANCQLGPGLLFGPTYLPVAMTVELRPITQNSWRAVPLNVRTPGHPSLYATQIQHFLEQSTDLSKDITRAVTAMAAKRHQDID